MVVCRFLFSGTFVVGLLVAGCSSSPDTAFHGICLGAERKFYDSSEYADPCTAYYNSVELCKLVEGCTWTASTFCKGNPRPCEDYSETQCDSAIGCQWYPRSQCADVKSCITMNLVDDGGCNYVIKDNVVSGCMDGVFIDFANLCTGAAPSTRTYGCN